MNNPYYQAIINAKNLIFDEVQYVQDALDSATISNNAVYANNMLNRMVEHLHCAKAIDKVAIVTVLLTGAFYNEFHGWVFYMPATRDCVANYRRVRSMLKRNRKLQFYCVEYSEN